MALRIRSKWQNRNASLEDNATALAYILWQLALEAAKNLHAEDFHYDNDEQRIGVIAEYLCFLVHVADRLAYRTMNADQRRRYVVALAQATARHLQRNQEDIIGSGDYRGAYIEQLNRRAEEYAATAFGDDQPGYDMLRCIGRKVQDIMGTSQTNRWVIDQVMEIDAPQAVDQVRRATANLFATSGDLADPG